MASEAQVIANRLNAQKSTGPRTPEGKAVVSQNAVKHGLLAKQAVIVGEDPGEFEFYRDQMVGELTPVGVVESMLAERAVSLSWRLRRAERLQNKAFDALYLKETTGLGAKLAQALYPKRPEGDPSDGDSALGRTVLQGFSNDRVLERLMMYERRIEHSLYKTMAELQKQRLLRELDPPMEEPPASATRPRADELLRQTKPIPGRPGAEGPARAEATADSAKQSQVAGLQTNGLAGKRTREAMRTTRNKANSHLRGFTAADSVSLARGLTGSCPGHTRAKTNVLKQLA